MYNCRLFIVMNTKLSCVNVLQVTHSPLDRHLGLLIFVVVIIILSA